MPYKGLVQQIKFLEEKLRMTEALVANMREASRRAGNEISRLQALADERVQGYNQLQSAVQDLEERLSAARKRIAALDKENDEFRSELAKLRPIVKPKFRVGQVVAFGQQFWQIRAFQPNGISPRRWEYDLGIHGGWQFETSLRALNDEEK